MSIKNLFILFFSIILIVVNYFILNEIISSKKEITKQTIVKIDKSRNIATSENNSKKQIQKKENNNTTIKEKNSKPLLSIIIDDVSFPLHLRLINRVNLSLNMSFLPSTSRHPKSHLLANDYDKYMVHLPLEASNYYASEDGTLKANSSYEEIEKKIKLIRSLFPKAKYINNHTGSKFTADLNAMRKLALALDKYNFIFLDSRTIATSQANIAFDYEVLERDTFLDNIDDIDYIKQQIKKAIKRSIKKGYAIAIGHPRATTLKAIRQMESYINKYTRLVYIDELHDEIYNK